MASGLRSRRAGRLPAAGGQAKPKVLPALAGVLAGILVLCRPAAAVEGEFTERTRERLAALITLETGESKLGEVLFGISEQSGLSFVGSVFVAKLPEPVAVIAKDVPAGDLIEAIAFAMHLDVHITPGGVVSFRMEKDDPRREALLRRILPPGPKGPRDEGRHGEGRHEEGPPQVGEAEIVERVVDGSPKVRAVLEKLGATLIPGKFHAEKRVWLLVVRRAGEEGPIGHVITSEDGDLIDIRIGHKGKKKHPKPERKEPMEPEERERF